MIRNSKSEFLRGVLLFNPQVYGAAGSPAETKRVASKIADYNSKKGGTWNYSNLYEVVKKVLKGMDKRHAISFFAAMEGPGEARAKSELFNFIYSELNLGEADYIGVGPNSLALNKELELKIQPDFGFKRQGKIYHALVYPNSEPALMRMQKEKIVAALAQPISLTTEEYYLCLIEFPKIGNLRKGKLEIFPFEYRELESDFIQHLEVFYKELENSRLQGDLFG